VFTAKSCKIVPITFTMLDEVLCLENFTHFNSGFQGYFPACYVYRLTALGSWPVNITQGEITLKTRINY
jgi:hypothetical protein